MNKDISSVNSEENNSENNEEYDYDISVYASDKENLADIQEIKRIKAPKEITSIQIRLSKLTNIKGINSYINLTHLDLSNNQIYSLKNVMYSLKKLIILDISCNKLQSLDGIEDLDSIKEINAAHNKISSLEPFSRFVYKKRLNT